MTFRPLAALLLLAFLTTVAFLPVLDNGFVRFDDDEYVVSNQNVRSGLTADGLAWAFTSVGYAANWHPLTWLTHMLDVELFGLEARLHHLTSLLLHLANALFLLVVMRRLTGVLWPSFAVAALFAVHPLHVESVAWVAERKDVLSGFFWLLTMAAYLWYLRRPCWRRYLALVLSFAFGLMAKPMLVTLPVILLVLDWWPLARTVRAPSSPGHEGRGGTGTPEASRAGRREPLFLLLEKLPLFALAAASSLLTLAAQAARAAIISTESLPLADRVQNAVSSYAAYLARTILPSNLTFFYPLPDDGPHPGKAVAAGIFLVALSALVVRLRGRCPYLAAGWLWYLAALVPVSGVVQVGWQSLADRYTYLPLIGIFTAVAWCAARVVAGAARLRLPTGIAAAAVLVLLAAASRAQVGHWRNTVALLEHAIEAVPDNYLEEFHLGIVLEAQGRTGEAVAHYRRALAIKPDYEDARMRLAAAIGHGRRQP